MSHDQLLFQGKVECASLHKCKGFWEVTSAGQSFSKNNPYLRVTDTFCMACHSCHFSAYVHHVYLNVHHSLVLLYYRKMMSWLWWAFFVHLFCVLSNSGNKISQRGWFKFQCTGTHSIIYCLQPTHISPIFLLFVLLKTVFHKQNLSFCECCSKLLLKFHIGLDLNSKEIAGNILRDIQN